ncbi:hypothetical protein NMG60_11004262 [Bertholletia excelsa]
MAAAAAAEAPENVAETERNNSPTQDMELETPNANAEEIPGAGTDGGDEHSKRAREEDEEEESNGAKKQRVERSAEEERLEKLEEAGEEDKSDRVNVGPKSFCSSIEMFDYFYKLLHDWPNNINVNKYEHMMLLDLLKKGHPEPEKKIGTGILAFQVRYHPQFKSRCFFIIRNDESVDDFSFRKCVDHILPLPENMQLKSNFNKGMAGRCGGKGGRRGRGRGRGRGGRSRN